jgi:hypothetical protein
MMKTLIYIISFLFAVNCFAQETLPQNVIDTLYVKALQQRIDLQLSSGYKYFDMQDQSDAPRKIFINNPIKILKQSEIIDISRKVEKELKVYTIKYYIVNKDTIDVNFGEYQLKALKKKRKNLPLAEISDCKCPTLPYEPDVRFALIDNKWIIIKSKFINN